VRPLDGTSGGNRIDSRSVAVICDTLAMQEQLERREEAFDTRLPEVQAAPADNGRVELIVRRPAPEQREILDEAALDLELGLVGDHWAVRDRGNTPVYMDAQLTVISTRVLAIIEPDESRWPLAGDQLYVDFDLSEANLPAGTRLAVGTSVIEISETPHTGCAKFSSRFGSDALRWINSPVGRANRMRGLNARIVEPGTVRTGDTIRRI
jgi:hypothetical protein